MMVQKMPKMHVDDAELRLENPSTLFLLDLLKCLSLPQPFAALTASIMAWLH